MGFNRTGQAQQPPRNTAPTWRGQGNPTADALRRPTRPQPGMRPQRPQGVGMRPQRPMPDMRPQMGGPGYGQQRAADRRSQMAANANAGMTPWQMQVMQNAQNRGSQKGLMELGGGDYLRSNQMNQQGLITQGGNRVKAEDLNRMGYKYESGMAPRRVTGVSGGDADIGMERQSSGRARGWYKPQPEQQKARTGMQQALGKMPIGRGKNRTGQIIQ